MQARHLFLYWLPVILYGGIIATFLSMSTPQTYLPGWIGEVSDKVWHALEYAIFAILWYRAFLCASGPRLAEFAGILAVLAAILFGVSDEFHQSFVPKRQADPWDLIADAAGSLIGVSFWQKMSPRFRYLQTP